ncbi:MAG: hypothetical protein IAE84_16260 [Saprospiraceae bacterium]|jgi:hypothetical protein|nr:hypothetical protein [Saprospiraceae bacterium]HRD81348.1 hypothetical protein [Saprospiraceae bacterium]HRJ15172.1 hypothetical protein [Saprospiraceae bacterium]HRK80042.1 hypothetical protein [Saprospiraceae bacterium]
MMIRNILILFLAFSAMQCARVTPIGDLLEAPEDYQKPGSATIKGTVTSKLDFMGLSTFKVMDADGDEIRVVSNQSYKKGDVVKVKGHVENLASLGNTQILVFQEDGPPAKE